MVSSRSRVMLLLLAVTLLLRLPYFFPDELGWDESSFIVVGQSILDGHLPYVEIWDIKPPLLFYFYAAAIPVFGHSLVGIRLWGALCVVATAFLVFLLVERNYDRRTSAWAGVLTVIAISLSASGQATMSEHVMLPALMAAMLLWTGRRQTPATAFWMGALLAATAGIRTNAVIPVAAIWLAFLVNAVRSGPEGWKRIVACIAGAVAVTVLVCLPYALAGELGLLWKSAVVAAVARSSTEHSAWTVAVTMARGVFDITRGIPGVNANGSWFAIFFWICAVLGSIVSLVTGDAGKRKQARLLALAAVTMGVGIAFSGGAHEHYLMQLVPFGAISAAILIQSLPGQSRNLLVVVAAAATALSMRPVAAEYSSLASRYQSGERLSYGPGFEIAEYLRKSDLKGRQVYLLTDPIAYWLTRSKPPTRLAHPSTIGRTFYSDVLGITPQGELARILDRVEFVVTRDELPFLKGHLKTQLETTLADRFTLVATVGDRAVYRRTPGR